MISVIPVCREGEPTTFNVIGTDGGEFILQGNLTVDQLRKLKQEVDAELKIVARLR